MARPPRFCAELGRYTPSDAAWGDDPRNHLSEIGGADPLRREGLRSGKPAVARQHRAPPGSRTTTVLRPSSGATSKSSSPDRGVPTPPRRSSLKIVLTRDELAATSNLPHGKERLRPQAPHHVKWPVILPPSKSSSPGEGARSACAGARYFGRPKLRPDKSPRRRTTSRRSTATVNLPQGSDAGSTPAAEASAGAPRLCGEIIATVDPCKEGRAHRGLSTRSSPSSSSNSGGPPRRGAISPRRFCGRVFIQPGFRGCRSTPPGGAVEIVLTEKPSKSSSPAVDALDSNGQFALRRIVRTGIGCRPPCGRRARTASSQAHLARGLPRR
jgi:hypothetical protein